MPVWLDAIPEKATKIARPSPRRWLLFLAFVMLGGVALTLWSWTSERTGFAFWFTALGLPFCTWGLIFGLRRFAAPVISAAPVASSSAAAVAAAGENLIGTIAGAPVQYARIVASFLIPGGSVGMATASESDIKASTTSTTSLNPHQDFVYWPD